MLFGITHPPQEPISFNSFKDCCVGMGTVVPVFFGVIMIIDGAKTHYPPGIGIGCAAIVLPFAILGCAYSCQYIYRQFQTSTYSEF